MLPDIIYKVKRKTLRPQCFTKKKKTFMREMSNNSITVTDRENSKGSWSKLLSIFKFLLLQLFLGRNKTDTLFL